jgi:chorismate mutase
MRMGMHFAGPLKCDLMKQRSKTIESREFLNRNLVVFCSRRKDVVKFVAERKHRSLVQRARMTKVVSLVP